MAHSIVSNTRGVTWGTSGAASGGSIGSGILTRVRQRKDGKTFELMDENAEVITVVLHDEKSELQVDVDTGTGTALPNRGDTLTVFGVAGKVLSAELVAAQGAVKKLSITATKWTNIA